MTDTEIPDMPAFYIRYDRKMRLLLAVALCASLLLSTIIATQMLAAPGGNPKVVAAIWRFGVFSPPLFTGAWWIFTELMASGRRKGSPPFVHFPASADDARNAMRIANAGFIFTLGLTVVGVAGQVTNLLLVLGHPLGLVGSLWSGRLTMMTVGAVTIYLGNVWPRMPILRAPEKKPALQMKTHRRIGWFMVIFGFGIVLFGLLLPYIAPRAGQPAFEPSKHKEISLPATQLDKFVGRYDFGLGFRVSVTHRGPTLWVTREGTPGEKGAPVYPEAPTSFFWKMAEAQIRFTIGANGAVTGAEFREDGPWQPGKRLTPG